MAGRLRRLCVSVCSQSSGPRRSVYSGPGGTTNAGLRRVGFQLQFAAEQLPSYLKEHYKVWPEVQEAMVTSGWHNYSLFHRPDGLIFGYFETDAGSFAQACTKLREHEVHEEWARMMSKYTVGNVHPMDTAKELTHYFYLGSDRKLDPLVSSCSCRRCANLTVWFDASSRRRPYCWFN